MYDGNDCFSTEIVVPDLASYAVSWSGDTTFCTEEGTVLSVTGNYDALYWDDMPSGDMMNFYESGTHILRAVFASGCERIDTITITDARPVLSISGDTLLCLGETALITASGSYDEVLWDGIIGGDAQAYTSTGDYEVEAITDEGCSIIRSFHIEVYEPISVTISDGADTLEMLAGSSLPLSLSIGTAYEPYTIGWNAAPGLSCTTCADPMASPLSTQVYTATITGTMSGCTSTDNVVIKVKDTSCRPLIPTAFSPNGDGINDDFRIFMNEDCLYDKISLAIYNRWGKKILTREDFQSGDALWDGSQGSNKADVAVYVYQLSIILLTGETTVHKGNITVVR